MPIFAVAVYHVSSKNPGAITKRPAGKSAPKTVSKVAQPTPMPVQPAPAKKPAPKTTNTAKATKRTKSEYPLAALLRNVAHVQTEDF